MTSWDSSPGEPTIIGSMFISTIPASGVANNQASVNGQHYTDGDNNLGPGEATVVFGGRYSDAVAVTNYKIIDKVTGTRLFAKIELWTYQLALS